MPNLKLTINPKLTPFTSAHEKKQSV